MSLLIAFFIAIINVLKNTYVQSFFYFDALNNFTGIVYKVDFLVTLINFSRNRIKVVFLKSFFRPALNFGFFSSKTGKSTLLRLMIIILYRDVYIKSMTIIIRFFLSQRCSTCIYFIGFYALQSVFFATIYNNM